VKRFSHGFSAKVSYTFSKLLDATTFLNNTDVKPWYGVSSLDRTVATAINGVWNLPLGRGHALASQAPKFLDAVIGGWQVSALIIRQSGDPLAWGNIIFNGDVNTINLPKQDRTTARWFNTGAGFVTTAAQQLANNLRTFPMRFAGIRGPGQSLFSLSAGKNFVLRERLQFQLRIDAFNAMNHPNFTDPNLTVTSAAFGQITAMNGYARNVQIAAKLRF
jgi:hypothetical protein